MDMLPSSQPSRKPTHAALHAQVAPLPPAPLAPLTDMMCSSLLLARSKQYNTLSSPRQYAQPPRGDTTAAAKSPPSRFPEEKDLMTWPCMVMRYSVLERLHTNSWSGCSGCSATLWIATSCPLAACGGLQTGRIRGTGGTSGCG